MHRLLWSWTSNGIEIETTNFVLCWDLYIWEYYVYEFIILIIYLWARDYRIHSDKDEPQGSSYRCEMAVIQLGHKTISGGEWVIAWHWGTTDNRQPTADSRQRRLTIGRLKWSWQQEIIAGVISVWGEARRRDCNKT